MLERDRELEQLSALLGDARAGSGGLVAVEGAAGLGKSRLLRWTVEQAAHEGMLALGASGGESERDISFGVALQLFEGWLASAEPEQRAAALSGVAGLALPLFEGLHWAPSEPPRERTHDALAHGLFWLLVNLSALSPVLLAVDDLHWSDPVSVRFLLYLAQRIDDLPVALVLTRRPAEGAGRELMDELANHSPATRLALAPLSVQAVSQLLAEAFEKPAGERFASGCSEATGGNPFLVEAIIRALQDDDVEPSDANAELIARLRPGVLGQQVLVRISRLGDDAARLAAAAAVLGDDALLVHAATIAGLTPDAAAAAADALVAADIFDTATPVAFAHPLLRAALYDEIPAARRARAHIRAARLLYGEHAPAEVVAAQLLPGARGGEPWVSQILRDAAARALAAGNPESAIHYLARALREPLDAGERAELLLELARAEASVGAQDAETHINQALELMVSPHARAGAHQALGGVLYAQGELAAAARAFAHGLELLGDRDEPLARDLRAGYFSAASLDPELAPRAFEHITPLLERPPGGETSAERGALAALAAHRAMQSAPREQAIALARRAWGEGALLADEGPDGWAWSLITGAFTWTDELEESLAICRAVIERARSSGSLMAYATASYCAQLPAHLAGRLSEARAHGEAALDARRYGWRTYATTLAATHARVLIDQGELDDAERTLETIDELPAVQPTETAMPLAARGQLRLLQGRHREALEDFLAAGELFSAIGTNPTLCPWHTGAALAAHQLGRHDRANELLAAATELAEETGTPTHIARVLRTRAHTTDSEHSTELLRQALSVLEHSQARLERLRCLADLGAALRRAGERAQARELLDQALKQAHHAGARLIEQHVMQELKIAGARPRRLAFSGAEALTASERRVADMAAEGMANREIAQALFVTPRTIEQHLYNTYKKLGIQTRVQLTDALRGEQTSTK